NLLYYVLFTCRLFAFGDDPFFYDKTLKKATYDYISDSIKALYKPLSQLTIDKTAVSLEKPVVFLVFNPLYKIFKIGNSKGDNYWEEFMYEDDSNVVNESDYIRIAINQLKETITENDFYIYYTIKKSCIYVVYTDEEVEKFDKQIRELLRENFSPSCIDIKYHSEEFAGFIWSKYNIYDQVCRSFSLSLEHDNYIFKVFIHYSYIIPLYKKIMEIINTHQDKQIETERVSYRYLHKSFETTSEKERNDLYILSMFDILIDSIDDNEITDFQETILNNIVKYLTNKLNFKNYLKDFFDEKSKSYIYIRNLKKAMKDFIVEKGSLIEEIGLECLKTKEKMDSKIYNYFCIMTKEPFKSGKFTAKILKFLSYDMDILAKLILSDDTKCEDQETPIRRVILEYSLEYCMLWIDYYIKYAQGDKEGIYPSDLNDFETLKNSCVALAMKNCSKEYAVSNYLVDTVDLYYKNCKIYSDNQTE
ncbi:hypothetical protein NGRA_2448, partial [Nosema granulosis]